MGGPFSSGHPPLGWARQRARPRARRCRRARSWPRWRTRPPPAAAAPRSSSPTSAATWHRRPPPPAPPSRRLSGWLTRRAARPTAGRRGGSLAARRWRLSSRCSRHRRRATPTRPSLCPDPSFTLRALCESRKNLGKSCSSSERHGARFPCAAALSARAAPTPPQAEQPGCWSRAWRGGRAGQKLELQS